MFNFMFFFLCRFLSFLSSSSNKLSNDDDAMILYGFAGVMMMIVLDLSLSNDKFTYTAIISDDGRNWMKKTGTIVKKYEWKERKKEKWP